MPRRLAVQLLSYTHVRSDSWPYELFYLCKRHALCETSDRKDIDVKVAPVEWLELNVGVIRRLATAVRRLRDLVAIRVLHAIRLWSVSDRIY